MAWIRVKIKDSLDFPTTTINISQDQGIKAVCLGLTSEIMAIMFHAEKWNADNAKEWVKENLERATWAIKNKGTDDIGWLFNDDYHIDLDTGEEFKVNPIKKHMLFEVKDFNKEERSFTAIATSEKVDRDGDILRNAGAKLSEFKKNPVILFSHEASNLAIGRAENVRKQNGLITFKVIFATKEANPLAENVFLLFEQDIMRSFSIRFMPIKAKRLPTPPPKENEIPKFPGMDFIEWELLEISAVNIPSNTDALRNKVYRETLLKHHAMEHHIEMPEPEKPCTNCKSKTIEETIEELRTCYIKDNDPNAGKRFYKGSADPDEQARNELHEKQMKLEDIKIKKEIIEQGRKIDTEIAELEKELDESSAKEKAIENISEKIQKLKTGITGLSQK